LRRRDEKSLAPPEDVDPRDLDRAVRAELRSLSKATADAVARHLVAAGRLVDTEPETALAHAYAARAHAARIAAVREAVGVTAYHAGEWAVALSELRAVRRMNGTVDHLPVEADCERALGRPERALELQRDSLTMRLDEDRRIELLIVAAGARRDMGQLDSAAVMLQVPELEARPPREWSARLRYAYADALLAAGRADEGRTWFGRTLEIDPDGETDVTERLLELDGVVLDDSFDDDYDEDEDEGEQPEASAVVGEPVFEAADDAPVEESVAGPDVTDPELTAGDATPLEGVADKGVSDEDGVSADLADEHAGPDHLAPQREG
jgi:tetratricopeptide (TPR) repeat protein